MGYMMFGDAPELRPRHHHLLPAWRDGVVLVQSNSGPEQAHRALYTTDMPEYPSQRPAPLVANRLRHSRAGTLRELSVSSCSLENKLADDLHQAINQPTVDSELTFHSVAPHLLSTQLLCVIIDIIQIILESR